MELRFRVQLSNGGWRSRSFRGVHDRKPAPDRRELHADPDHGVPMGTQPTATFSTTMDASTVTASNIKCQIYNKKKKWG